MSNIDKILESTGRSFMLSFLSSVILNSRINRSKKAILVKSWRSGGEQAQNTFLHSIGREGYLKVIGCYPNTFMSSFISGTLFGFRKNLYSNIFNGVRSGLSDSIMEKIYKK